MANAIIIFPYRYQQTWVFDDEKVGLVKEPFVSGIPEMLDILVQDLPHHDETSSYYFPLALFLNIKQN